MTGRSTRTFLNVAELTVDDSDKVITVPNHDVWVPDTIFVSYTTNSAAGNRQLFIEYRDFDGNVIQEDTASITQEASDTIHYTFNIGGNHDVAAISDPATADTFHISQRLKFNKLNGRYTIRIRDLAAIAPTGTGENMLIRISGERI